MGTRSQTSLLMPSSLTFFFLHFRQSSSWLDSQFFSWGKYGSVICIRCLSPHERCHRDVLHSLRDNRNIVLKTGLKGSRKNHTSLIILLAASRYDLRPKTVASSAGGSKRSQDPAEWRAERLKKVITVPLLLKWKQPGCSRADWRAGWDLRQPVVLLCRESLAHHSSAGRKSGNLDCLHSII